jgi:hypothetical protein
MNKLKVFGDVFLINFTNTFIIYSNYYHNI